MSADNRRLRQQSAALQEIGQQYLGNVGSILVDAAKQSDTVEGLGINQRIVLGHTLVDMWVKGAITLAQALLANPADGRFGPLKDYEPWPSDPIVVTPRSYPRTITACGRIRRVGLDDHTLPNPCITFEPPVLGANETHFRIELLDYGYVGANYTGRVTLMPVGGRDTLPDGDTIDEPEFTVGL